MVYLIHFDEKFKHARHYIGFVDHNLEAREKKHRDGTGAKILKAVNNAGINWNIVRVWKDGDRNFERSLKNRKKSSDICPCCNKNCKEHLYKPKKEKKWQKRK